MATAKKNAGGAKSDPAAAIKLAAELNALSDGCASAEGGTVKLIRAVQVQKKLAVPAGVTLDLTGQESTRYGVKDARLELQDGAVLTVDGTINTACTRIDACGKKSFAVINGSGTINLKIDKTLYSGSMLEIRNGEKLTLDGVTLAGHADNDRPLVSVSDGGEFVMKSGKITGNTNKDKGAQKVSAVTTISNGGGDCGGVRVGQGGTFTMKGGEISGNSAGNTGGGVQVGYGGDEGAFIMEGGKITGNSSVSGGGVFVSGGCAFTLKGGEISGNKAKDGGNLYVGRNTSGRPVVGTANWGKGGKYTKGGAAQTGGGSIIGTETGGTNDALIAAGK